MNELILFKVSKKTQIILLTQMIGLLIGSFNHLKWIVLNGFISENYNAPLFSKIFWDSLALFDPLALLFLFLRPKTGIYLTLTIICLDVLHNNTIFFDALYLQSLTPRHWLQKNWMVFCQIGFGLFVVATLKQNVIEFKNVKYNNI